MSPSSSVETRIADLPVVMVTPEGDGPVPLVLCWHGFGPPASAEALARELPLERIDAWKVYPDLPLFGRRRPWDGPRELGRRQADDYLLQLLWPVLQEAVSELPDLIEALEARLGRLWDGRLALVGRSAGGMATLLALAEGAVAADAAVAVGAPPSGEAALEAFEAETELTYEWSPEARAAARRLDFPERAGRIAAGRPPPALLLIVGEEGERVAPTAGRALHEALTEAYRERDAADRLGLQVLPGAGHEASGADRIEAWLDRFLPIHPAPDSG